MEEMRKKIEEEKERTGSLICIAAKTLKLLHIGPKYTLKAY